jgi:acetylornithine/succinyldiaminopimelate/putrescine aminotransferase
MNQQEVMQAFGRHVSPSHVRQLAEIGLDFVEAGGEGSWLLDEDGNRYLDCYGSGGTFLLGRHHPDLVASLRRAMKQTDQGNFPMISEEKVALARELARFCPGDLECTVFSVMRGETIEFACKIARGVTRRAGILALAGGWHGETGFAMALSDRTDHDRFGPGIPGIRRMSWGDPSALLDSIDRDTAAVVLEPMQVENGCRVVPADLLVEIRRRCDRRGALLVLDETRTALGWTGYRFASEPSGVVPDMMILGESLGGGLFPIAATVFTQRVNAFLNRHPLIHLSTFGGSDVGCTVAREMLAVCERVLPWTLAGECGAVLGKGLGMAARANPDVVESIRGAGMVWSLNTPDQATAKSLCRQLRVNGVVAMPGNVQRNTVVLRPSLLATRDELAFLVKAVEKAVAGVGTDPEARA